MEKENKITVHKLLNKYNLYTKQIGIVIYHLNIKNCNASDLVYTFTKKSGLTEEEMGKEICNLIIRCDENSKSYDSKLDEEITRYGTRSNVFYGGHNKNIWNNGMFEDDGFGFGTEPTSIYDDYIDSDYGRKKK